ncbi:MAG: MiaB/RimO family radical SAM methylthiotransferase, partial [Campylobacteraceae bacterium]|nr:MiaB/RimO family radical SAM methylthiotransferase [Campylobacteraceae bacterium]
LSRGKTFKVEGLVFGVIGHSQKANLGQLLAKNSPFFQKGDLLSLDEPKAYSGHKTKAFVKIQEGCDFQCSYCIIPSVRGKARSHKEIDLLNQVRILIDEGFSEVVLTGTNIGSYGKDTKTSLGNLLEKIGSIKGLRRVRLGSIEPVQIDEKVLEILNESWIERHLHLALQHTSPKMLRLMRRRNRVEKDLELFETLSSRGFALGTDFITGHPGESEYIWKEAWGWITRFPLTHLHGFTYSKRDGTPSAKMNSIVPGNIAKKRLKELEALVLEKNIAFRHTQKDKSLEVLIEESDGKNAFGYDQFYNPVRIYGRIERHSWVNLTKYAIKEKYNEAII